MSEITFKEYDRRPKVESTVDVCECGHQATNHSYPSKFFVDKENKCDVCMCEHYKKITTMNITEYFKINYMPRYSNNS